MLDNDKSVAIYRSISDDDEERVFNHWHASSIAMCPRAHYMKRLGIPRVSEPSAAKILRWSAGHLMEKAIRKHVNNVYGKAKSNVRLTSKVLDFTGEYDNLVVKDNLIIEIKSVHDYAVIVRDGVEGLKEATGGRGPRGGVEYRIKQGPYIHHAWQNHGYVILLAEKDIPVRNITYVYITLSGRLVVYTTKVDKDIVKKVEARLRLLNEAWETKTPPECICHRENDEMYDGVLKWCDYKNEDTGECCRIPEVVNG